MNKKPGFQFKIGGEALLFIVMGIIIVLFMFFMPNIYKIISDLKTGNLFKSEETPVINNSAQNNQDEGNLEEPKGELTLICTKTNSKPAGNLIETYTFYYNNDRLESVKNNKNYDAISDEYLNYVYSEYAEFTKINDTYKKTSGFSSDVTLESRTLTATFVYDLTKLSLSDLNNINETLTNELNNNQSIDMIKQEYVTLGYICR